jgi:signal transduction histidine kinase
VNVVLGYIDLLLDNSFGPLEQAQRDILRRITTNANNLSRLINDLVDVMQVLLAGYTVTFEAKWTRLPAAARRSRSAEADHIEPVGECSAVPGARPGTSGTWRRHWSCDLVETGSVDGRDAERRK